MDPYLQEGLVLVGLMRSQYRQMLDSLEGKLPNVVASGEDYWWTHFEPMWQFIQLALISEDQPSALEALRELAQHMKHVLDFLEPIAAATATGQKLPRRYFPNVGESHVLRGEYEPIHGHVQGSWAMIHVWFRDGTEDDLIIHESELPRGVALDKALASVVPMHFLGRIQHSPLQKYEFRTWL